MKIGRNDPCSCGSGKKYKHCCLANELAVREDASISALTSGLPSGEFASSLPDLDGDVMSPQYWEAMELRIPRKLRKEFEPILQQAKAAIDFEAHQRAIEEAQVVLEKYRKPFERLLKNTKKLLAQAEKLFDEAPFESMWFSVDDLQRAFEAVGYPPMNRNDAPFFDAARATIDFLVDVPRRHELSRQLFILVPDYVEADRPLDAWILQHNAMMLEDLPEKVCGMFLLCMFFHGMKDWEAQREREQLALFSEMGLDPDEMQRRGFEGVAEMLQEVASNPEKLAEVEAFLESHPQFKSDMQAECWTSEKPILIDVRSAEEFAEGHLDGALLMPHTQIGTMIGAQVPDKNTPIILYCHSGFRAVIAKGKLKLRGYKRVQNFGGMASAGKKLNERVVL